MRNLCTGNDHLLGDKHRLHLACRNELCLRQVSTCGTTHCPWSDLSIPGSASALNRGKGKSRHTGSPANRRRCTENDTSVTDQGVRSMRSSMVSAEMNPTYRRRRLGRDPRRHHRGGRHARPPAAPFGGHHHQRNAKLQLTVALAPAEAVPGLYVHPDHRRRRRRPIVRSEFDV